MTRRDDQDSGATQRIPTADRDDELRVEETDQRRSRERSREIDLTEGERDEGRGRAADTPKEIPPRGWMDILKRTFQEVKADHISIISAGVAFYGMLALFPALIAVVSIYGFFADPATVQSQIQEISDVVPPEARTLILDQLRSIVNQADSSLSVGVIVGVLGALWSASSGMKALMEGTNIAYDETDDRKFFKKRGLALLLTLGGMILAIVALGAIVAVPAILESLNLPSALTTVLSVSRWVLLAALAVVGVAAVYRYAPDRDNPRWRWVSWGGVIATVSWVAASIAFSIYTSEFGSYNQTYGALAAVVILLLWLYISALVVLFGAELNAEMEHQTAKDTTKGPGRPMGQRDAVVADEVGEPATRR